MTMMDAFSALPVLEQLSPALSRRQRDELELIVIDHPAVRAAIALQGAHLISWTPAGEQEAIWLSSNTPFTKGSALRGGVPVCWPWFGPAEQPGLPAHGFARNLPWTLSAHQEDEQGVVLTFELHDDEYTRSLWPHEFTLFARFRLGKRCEIELEAHGDFSTTCALHSYLQVGDINQVTVSGLGHSYIDKVADGKRGELSDGIQTFPDRTDRVYLEPEACSLIQDKSLNRSLEVIHHHHRNVVGWNPGPALSASMKDMPDDGYRHFVCVETAVVDSKQKASPENPARLATTFVIRRNA
ncbi:D-hexose-6-phosphate mutarotase [Salmonella enterica subsp. enterica serovar Choleraesuis]|nr:D-hexose-6-phosphate mutarotase [Salmonella enterica subsp. enterica serovar Choleraesuis]